MSPSAPVPDAGLKLLHEELGRMRHLVLLLTEENQQLKELGARLIGKYGPKPQSEQEGVG